MGRKKLLTGAAKKEAITYKLVHRPRDDELDDGDFFGNAEEDASPVDLVPEAELRRHMYRPERQNMRPTRASEQDEDMMMDWEDEWYEEEDEEDDETQWTAPARTSNDMETQQMPSSHPEDGGEEEEEAEAEEPLFEDAIEGGVTDDFIRQLVLGTGGEGEGDAFEGDEDWDFEEENEEDAGIPLDGEVWRLLSEEERAGVLAAQQRGTQRVRTHANHPAPLSYPTHDVDSRPIDRQFTEMMREFNVDMQMNDVANTDPRTQGPLSVHKYISALEEFVADRAGMDMESAELLKNRGRLHQLRLLSHREGAFDVDTKDGGVFYPAIPSEKQARFAASFAEETERIRAEAAARVRKAQREEAAQRERGGADMRNETASSSSSSSAYEVQKVRRNPKASRVDCETVLSTYSTCANQPNVIRPRAANRRPPPTRRTPSVSDEESDEVRSVTTQSTLIPAMTERRKGETKEEKKQRRQAVKEAQRQRRQEKSALRQAYKNVEASETKKVSLATVSKRMVHFA